jgi:hypothetical protein
MPQPYTLKNNGPFGKREDFTEYALIVNGAVRVSHSGNPVIYTDHADAVFDAEVLRLDGSEVHVLHRRVTRDAFYATTG